MITVTFTCGGCDATVDGKKPITREFLRLHHKSNFGVHGSYNIKAVAPDDWMIGDPYTDCVYCPKCWKEIENDEVEQPVKSGTSQ